jgi:hypothetical protein
MMNDSAVLIPYKWEKFQTENTHTKKECEEVA